MKTFYILILTFLIPVLGFSQLVDNDEGVTQKSSSLKSSISVTSTPELLEVTNMLADKYSRINPKYEILVSGNLEGKAILPEGSDISFIAGSGNNLASGDDLKRIKIGRDVVVPIISSDNPYLDLINKQGISQIEIARAFSNSESQSWGDLLGITDTKPVKIYMADDEFVSLRVTDFAGQGQELEGDVITKPVIEVINAVKSDPYAIGFCKMNNIHSKISNNFIESITILPIDRNGNNIIDHQEKIYADYNAFSRGVWIGKYPRTLYQNIYSVFNESTSKVAVHDFLKWVVTNGQPILAENGFDDLVYSERLSNVESLFYTPSEPVRSKGPKGIFAGQKLLVLIIGLFMITGILANVIASLLGRRQGSVQPSSIGVFPVLNENSVKVRKGVYFDKTHSWAFMDENGGVKIGIDDFLQKVTGPITRVKMKMPGERIKRGDKVLSIIQRGKQLNIYSPVSGVITEQNIALENDSSMLNSSPYENGWVYKIEPSNWLKETQMLILGHNYGEWLNMEFIRLKEFLSEALKSKSPESAQVVMQDGGELRDCIMMYMGPEIWEDFQTNFIDSIN